MKKNIYAALALFVMLTGAAQADVVDSNTHSGATSVDYFGFNVDTDGLVNIYTESGAPSNPYLTLWSTTAAAPTAADWVKVGSNDNTATLDFNETVNSLDAQLKLNLTVGSYLATVTGSGFSPVGSLLSDGFTGTSAQSFFQYNLFVVGNVLNLSAIPAPAAVPLPAAVWLFGTGLMTFLGFAKRKGQQQVIC